MPTPTKGPRLGGSSAHQRHIMANLATALFEHGKITTTEAKARRLRPYAERLITFAKRGDLHARREVLTVVTDKGGYTRITKIGPRKGDNAPLAVIELVEEEAAVAAPSRRRRPRRAQPAPARPAPAPAAEEAALADDEAAEVAEDTAAADMAEDADDAAVQDAADEAGAAGDESGAEDEADEDAAEGEPE